MDYNAGMEKRRWDAMEKFIPYDKMSKKKKQALNARRRKVWAISPVTRKPKNPRAYDRNRVRREPEE